MWRALARILTQCCVSSFTTSTKVKYWGQGNNSLLVCGICMEKVPGLNPTYTRAGKYSGKIQSSELEGGKKKLLEGEKGRKLKITSSYEKLKQSELWELKCNKWSTTQKINASTKCLSHILQPSSNNVRQLRHYQSFYISHNQNLVNENPVLKPTVSHNKVFQWLPVFLKKLKS